MMPDFVWVVAEKDYGDNGWHIARVFLTREEAEAFVVEHPIAYGYYDIQQHHVGDKVGDLIGSEVYYDA